MLIKKLALTFGSRAKAQEILLVKQGVKDVVRQGFYPAELEKVEEFCTQNNLYLVKSNFKVIIADEGDYSNKGLRISEQDKRPGMYFVYISQHEEKAWLAAYHEMMNDHRALGLLLGYPACCVDFFLAHFKESHTNLEQPSQNPFTVISQRSQDYVLLSHFPCTAACAGSTALGKRYYETIRKLDKSWAEELMSALSQK